MSDLEPLRPGASLRERVEAALAAAIVSGEMAPGAVFSAPALAVRFGVSATPVREAMLNLVERGFVEPLRNKGFRVTAVSHRELTDVVEVRRLLEPAAVRRLAASFPRDQEAGLRLLADRIVAGARAGDLGAYLHADADFHLRLLGLLGNDRLVQVVAGLRAQTRLVGLADLLGTPRLERSAAEHHELLDLLVAGDAPGVEELMDRHVRHVLGWWAGKPEV